MRETVIALRTPSVEESFDPGCGSCFAAMAYARDCSKFTSKAYTRVGGTQVRYHFLAFSVEIVSISSLDSPAMNLLNSQYAKHVLSVQKPHLSA